MTQFIVRHFIENHWKSLKNRRFRSCIGVLAIIVSYGSPALAQSACVKLFTSPSRVDIATEVYEMASPSLKHRTLRQQAPSINHKALDKILEQEAHFFDYFLVARAHGEAYTQQTISITDIIAISNFTKIFL